MALAVLTVSLAFLGVKLPWSPGISSTAGKPKPRPRAILQNQIKTCKQTLQETPTVAATLEAPPVIPAPAIFSLSLAVLAVCYRSYSPLQQKSRDPPVLI